MMGDECQYWDIKITCTARGLTKPAYNGRQITPHLPTQYKCNSESQESNASRILSSSIADDGNDSNIEQINEELIRSDLFNF